MKFIVRSRCSITHGCWWWGGPLWHWDWICRWLLLHHPFWWWGKGEIFYHILWVETVLVPIIDQNTQANSYNHLQIDRPYIALNSESYIWLGQPRTQNMQENWLQILLQKTVHSKDKSKYSCESALYFDLDSDIFKENCNFTYYFNKRYKTYNLWWQKWDYSSKLARQ